MNVVMLVVVASVAALGKVLTIVLRLFVHCIILAPMRVLVVRILGLITRRDHLSHLQGLKDQRVVASIITGAPFVYATRI
jgi:hypothetical protein